MEKERSKLVIDIGNTLHKVAVFKGDKLTDLRVLESATIDVVKNLTNREEPVSSAILSYVNDFPKNLKNFLIKNFHFIELSDRTPIPVINLYKTPETLGRDRLAAVVAAADRYPDSDVLVVDAGTCITYDFLDKSNVYHGGAISPGVEMRLKALHNFTGKLPLIKPEIKAQFIGQNTQQSILSGVINGTFMEIDGMISFYREMYPEIKIILSGGDASYFDKRLKNNIFAFPNIVLYGLNLILDYNIE